MTTGDELRRTLALACRVLAAHNCVREITGHVSCRVPGTDEIMVRCRNADDPGVEYTTVDDIHQVGLDATNSDLPDGYALPGEFPIHSEIYRARPDVGGVVHGHPESSLMCGVLGLPIVPFVGAYDPVMMTLADQGVARYPRGVLISTQSLGVELVEAMDQSDTCLLVGHGVVTTGPDVVTATLRAVKLETLSRLTLEAHQATGDGPRRLADADIDEVNGFVRGANAAVVGGRWIWEFYVRSLGANADVSGRL